jgi:hypothetical protein
MLAASAPTVATCCWRTSIAFFTASYWFCVATRSFSSWTAALAAESSRSLLARATRCSDPFSCSWISMTFCSADVSFVGVLKSMELMLSCSRFNSSAATRRAATCCAMPSSPVVSGAKDLRMPASVSAITFGSSSDRPNLSFASGDCWRIFAKFSRYWLSASLSFVCLPAYCSVAFDASSIACTPIFVAAAALAWAVALALSISVRRNAS